MDVTIWHSPDFGHKVAITTQRQGQVPNKVGDFAWKGLGVSNELVKQIQACVSAVVADHLVFRYGVADELDLHWAGDPEPF
jgi:hypothetical protein